MEKSRPGIIIYFELRPALEMLDDGERGKLFMAMLNYAEWGELPELEGLGKMAWSFIQPKLDLDNQRYELKCEKSRYAVYCREIQKSEGVPLSFEEWREREYRLLSADNVRYPTTTETPNSAETPTINATEKSKTNLCATETGKESEKGEKPGLPGAYRPLSESDFERERQRKLLQLEGRAGG